jgi:hypothetical protein
MFNTKIIKKMKEDSDASKDMESMGKYAREAMKPEEEDEDEEEGEESEKKEIKSPAPSATLQIDLILNAAKKKKGMMA